MKSTRTHRISTLLILIFLLWHHPTGVDAQQEVEVARGELRFGPYAHLLLVTHPASFATLPGVPNCCQEFTGGSGYGFDFGGLALFRLADPLDLELRAGLVIQSVEMREEEGTTVIIDGVPTEGAFEHQLDVSIVGVELAPGVLWRPLGERLGLHLGTSFGFHLSSSFEGREVLLEPESVGLFENNRRIRNEQEGEIPDAAALRLALHGGFSFELPLNSSGTLHLAPEIRFSLGLTDLIPDSTWRSNWIALGASMRFGRVGERSQEIVPDPPVPPSDRPVTEAEPPGPPFLATIEARGLDDTGMEKEIAVLRVEEFISTNMRPLLNYVFFDENIHTIPRRYIRLDPGETGDFDVDRLHSVPVIRTYHHLLNIVGERMREIPGAVVMLTGTNDGLGERLFDGSELSARRARSVREYLIRVWGIDSARLPIAVRDLPETPSNTEVADGIEENRRVELVSDTWEVLEPVVTVDTLRLTNPPNIRIHLGTDLKGPVAEWTVVVRQGGQEIRSFSAVEGAPDRLPRSIDWNLSEDQRNIPRSDQPITFELTVTDTAGVAVSSVLDTLHVDQVTVSEKRRERVEDRYIDRYSLILFDFDRSDLNEANDTIAAFIRGRIAPEATVEIVGQTDRIGESDYNLRLSRGRASSTARALDLPDSVATGEGENVEIYDNDLPEGRFYSRTVRIQVETPIPAARDPEESEGE